MKLKKCFSIILSAAMIATLVLPVPAYASSDAITVSDCDSINGWSNYPGDGMGVDTSEKSQGEGSIKLWQTGQEYSFFLKIKIMSGSPRTRAETASRAAKRPGSRERIL